MIEHMFASGPAGCKVERIVGAEPQQPARPVHSTPTPASTLATPVTSTSARTAVEKRSDGRRRKASAPSA